MQSTKRFTKTPERKPRAPRTKKTAPKEVMKDVTNDAIDNTSKEKKTVEPPKIPAPRPKEQQKTKPKASKPVAKRPPAKPKASSPPPTPDTVSLGDGFEVEEAIPLRTDPTPPTKKQRVETERPSYTYVQPSALPTAFPAPTAAALPAPTTKSTKEVGPYSAAYKKLKEGHEKLQKKYKEIKAMKLSEVEKMLKEQSGHVKEQGKIANKLVQEYKKIAEQAEASARGLSTDLKARIDSLNAENVELKKTLTEKEGRLMYLEQHLREMEGRVNSQVAASSSGAVAALEFMTGLRPVGAPSDGRVTLTHPGTGFRFQLGAADPPSDDEEEEDGEDQELAYYPLKLGRARGVLPAFLEEEITFGRSQLPTLISKLLSALPS